MPTEDYIRETAADTAKKVRVALKKHFPKYPAKHFSVTSDRYTGGSSVSVSWEDSPTEREVSDVISRFGSATFDGQTDMKSLHGYIDEDGKRYIGAHYILTSHVYSKARYAQIKLIAEVVYGKNTSDKRLLERISKEIDEGKHNEHLTADAKFRTPAEFAEKVMDYVIHHWYNQGNFGTFVTILVNQKNAHTEYTPESFITKYRGQFIAFAATQEWCSRAEKRGFSTSRPFPVHLIMELAEKYAFNTMPENLEDAVTALNSSLIGELADAYTATQFTAHDQKLVEYAWGQLVREDAYYLNFKDMPLDQQRLLEAKRLTDAAQVRDTIVYIKEAVAQLAAKKRAGSPTEKDMLRMHRLKTLTQLAGKANHIPPVQVSVVQNVPSIKVSNRVNTVYINTFGVFESVEGGLKSHISRTNSDSFACFERAHLPLALCMGLEQAIYFEGLIQWAFDLRKKV